VAHERRHRRAGGGQLGGERAHVLQHRRARRPSPAARQQHRREALQLGGRIGQDVSVGRGEEEAQEGERLARQAERGRATRHRRERLHRLLVRVRQVSEREQRERAAEAGQDGGGARQSGVGLNRARPLLLARVAEQRLVALLLVPLLVLSVQVHAPRVLAGGRGARRLSCFATPRLGLLCRRRGRHHRRRVAQRLQRSLKRNRVEQAERGAAGGAEEEGVGGGGGERGGLRGAAHQRAQPLAQRRRLHAARGQGGPEGGVGGGERDAGPVRGRHRARGPLAPSRPAKQFQHIQRALGLFHAALRCELGVRIRTKRTEDGRRRGRAPRARPSARARVRSFVSHVLDSFVVRPVPVQIVSFLAS